MFSLLCCLMSYTEPKIIKKIQNAFEELATAQNGNDLLEHLKIEGFETASNENWDDVRALNISLLEK